VAVPTLTSFSNCNDAIQALKAVHLVGTCPPADAQYSSTAKAGAILGTKPTGTALYGSTVTIITSKGHAPVVVPTLTGPASTYATASAALTAAGFVASENREYSSTVPTGQVIGSAPDPTSGPQPFGSTVVVSVSIGPQPVVVPNVDGDTIAHATAVLEGLGLQVSGPYGPPGAKHVLSTDPVAGTSVLPGTAVNVYTQ
jgi:serine/threonine-protein kinase